MFPRINRSKVINYNLLSYFFPLQLKDVVAYAIGEYISLEETNNPVQNNSHPADSYEIVTAWVDTR